MTADSGGRRRSRRRATAPQGPAPLGDASANASSSEPSAGAVAPPAVPPAKGAQPTRTTQPARTEQPGKQKRAKPKTARPPGPRGERDLAGAGGSQVGPTGAMRARDLNRPTADDLAEAEAELEIVRRHWSPTPDGVEQPRAPRRRRA